MIKNIQTKMTLTYCRLSIKLWAGLFKQRIGLNFVSFHWNFVVIRLHPSVLSHFILAVKKHHIYLPAFKTSGLLNNEVRDILDMASLGKTKITSC